jgi:transposase
MALRDLQLCPECLRRGIRIDELEAKVRQLERRLRERDQPRAAGFFGVNTPSAKLPVKPDSLPERQARCGGAQPGHRGHGRRLPLTTAEPPIVVPAPTHCPQCHGPLQPHDQATRTVRDLIPARVVWRRYRLERRRCVHCGTVVSGPAPGVQPRQLLSNRLLAHATAEAFREGLTQGQVQRRLGLNRGTVVAAWQRLADTLSSVYERLIRDFRAAPVRFADETSWRTDGANTWAWLFGTTQLSVYCFRPTRAGTVPADILGPKPLAGSLNVDRYAAYHQLALHLQYCYAHLLRDLQDLEKQDPDSAEVKAFVASLAPRLADAMALHRQRYTRRQYDRRARQLKRSIVAIVSRPANHPAIRAYQDIFTKNSHRLYHWATDRRVPADNNAAERGLRPLVIARKISFGSQSPRGSRTREILMSVLDTLHKRGRHLADALTQALDHRLAHPAADLYPVLFPATS